MPRTTRGCQQGSAGSTQPQAASLPRAAAGAHLADCVVHAGRVAEVHIAEAARPPGLMVQHKLQGRERMCYIMC